jgi:uncharacterized protein YodC (DUF2158 family)
MKFQVGDVVWDKDGSPHYGVITGIRSAGAYYVRWDDYLSQWQTQGYMESEYVLSEVSLAKRILESYVVE